MKTSLLVIALSVSSLIAFAQVGVEKMSVVIQNEKSEPVPQATASLVMGSTKKLVKSNVADNKGTIVFEGLAKGIYLLKISAAGYQDRTVDSVSINDNSSPLIVVLHASAANLAAVTVTAKKPFIQRLNDRLIVNVDNSVINAGSSAFEVLERSPGVVIDNNDNISLRGKQGVIVMIDGKPTPMAGEGIGKLPEEFEQ